MSSPAARGLSGLTLPKNNNFIGSRPAEPGAGRAALCGVGRTLPRREQLTPFEMGFFALAETRPLNRSIPPLKRGDRLLEENWCGSVDDNASKPTTERLKMPDPSELRD